MYNFHSKTDDAKVPTSNASLENRIPKIDNTTLYKICKCVHNDLINMFKEKFIIKKLKKKKKTTVKTMKIHFS
jgi:hypothetical protein